MSSFWQFAAQPRSRRGVRSWSVAVVSCGALLVPSASALADDSGDMAGMNGMACPHASGEGPDALAAAGPNEPAAPQHAPNDTPIGPAATSPATTPATDPADKPVSEATKPASKVAQPVAQDVTQGAATTPAQVTVRAVATTPARTAITTPARVHAPRAKHHGPTVQRPAVAHRFYGPATPTAEFVPTAGHRVLVEAATPGGSSTPLIVLVGLLGLSGAGAAVVMARRRRGYGGVATLEQPQLPPAPAYADPVEAELHEMISEANACPLLSRDEREEEPEQVELIGIR
jgi:hypothetical protein